MTDIPLQNRLYYEDQKEESIRSSVEFRAWRLPKFLSYFALVIKENNPVEGSTTAEDTPNRPHVIGTKTTTADISLFHVLSGMEYAFPRRMATLRKDEGLSEVFKLVDAMRAEPPLEAYLASKRRAAFGMGIFR